MLTNLKLIYHKLPSTLRWLFYPIAIAYRFFLRSRIDIWIIKGDDKKSRKMSLLYVGSEKHKNYFKSMVFNNVDSEMSQRKWINKIFTITKNTENQCSLKVLEISRNHQFLFKSNNSFFIPLWVDGVVNIPDELNLLIKKENLKSDIRKINNNDLQFELADKENQYHDFYENMYLPYIQMAHGNKAILMSPENMMNKRNISDLLLIKKDNEYIGGVIIVYESGIPRIWSIGVKNADIDYLKLGLLSSLYYFSIKFLKEKGYHKVNVGLSRAYINDGVLKYKKKWNIEIVKPSKKGFLVLPTSSDDVVRDFFVNNPFIYTDKNRFACAIFLEPGKVYTKKKFKKLYNACKLEGISKLDIYSFDDDKPILEDIVSNDVSDHINVISGYNLS